MTDIESATGHFKNSRNQLENMVVKSRHGEEIDQESIEYALDELLDGLERLSED